MASRPYVKYRPNGTVKENPSAWWKYAYNSLLEHNVKPYTWSRVIEHRRNYRKYKEACLQSLLRPNDTELKLDLQKYEDRLSILNIVIAREHARQELKNKVIEEKHQSTNTDVPTRKIIRSASSTEGETGSIDTENIKVLEQESKELSRNSISDESGGKLKLEKLPQPIGIVYERSRGDAK